MIVQSVHDVLSIDEIYVAYYCIHHHPARGALDAVRKRAREVRATGEAVFELPGIHSFDYVGMSKAFSWIAVNETSEVFVAQGRNRAGVAQIDFDDPVRSVASFASQAFDVPV